LTRAELSNYTVTSSHADVVAFLDSLQRLGAPIWTGNMGMTTEGRTLPYVILSRPLVTTPVQARRLGRPVVFVQGNIHSGEVEGKEALQAMIRDLVFSRRPNVLDSIVLIALPNYNADGNERLAPQATSRGSQQGPELVGTRPNAQGFNLNRDYVKAEAPETRAALALLNDWDPDVFVDLHTTNGSYHGYALTYAPSLSPAAFFGGVYARDSLLPEIRTRMRTRHGFDTFDYGNFSGDSANRRWVTYEHMPRYGSNYYGLRGRIGILSEGYSHDPFERRVRSTYAFVQEILSLVAERGPEIVALSRTADEQVTAWGVNPAGARSIPVRSRYTSQPPVDEVLVEDVVRTAGDTTLHEAGMPRGMRRTGNINAVRMPVVVTFEPVLERPVPHGWVVPDAHVDAIRLLRLHGVAVEQLEADWRSAVEVFRTDSLVRAPREYEGHNLMRLEGNWREESRTIPRGAYVIPAGQPLGVLALYLLEPESDDGFATWNMFDAVLRAGGDFPVLRIANPITAPRRIVE
jgi:murein tripeptide amidase MpaA